MGDDRYYEMEMLDEFYKGAEPLEILHRTFYGHDDETWTTDSSGNKIYGQFNPNRDYFYYNGYGNLISADYKDYSGHLDSYFVEEMLDNRQHMYSIEENVDLCTLFDELEEV